MTGSRDAGEEGRFFGTVGLRLCRGLLETNLHTNFLRHLWVDGLRTGINRGEEGNGVDQKDLTHGLEARKSIA